MNQSHSTPPELLAYLKECERMSALQKYCFKTATQHIFHTRQYYHRLANPTIGVLEKRANTVSDTKLQDTSVKLSVKSEQDTESNHTVQCFNCRKVGQISCNCLSSRSTKCTYCDSHQHTRENCPQAADGSKPPPTGSFWANVQVVLFHSIPL